MKDNPLWHGTAPFSRGFFKFLWVALLLVVVWQLWGTALRLAHFPPPTKTTSLLVALAAVILFLWSLWNLFRAGQLLGLRDFSLLLLATFVGLVAFNIFTIPRTASSAPQHALDQTTATFRTLTTSTHTIFQTLLSAPSDFRFAYAGQRRPPTTPPGFPTPNPAATPIQAIVVAANAPIPSPTPIPFTSTSEQSQPIPTPHSSTATPIPTPLQQRLIQLQVGGQAQVVNTNGQRLRARAAPSLEADIVAHFLEGSHLQIIDGPRDADGFTWWQLRSPDGEGWCADRWLAPLLGE